MKTRPRGACLERMLRRASAELDAVVKAGVARLERDLGPLGCFPELGEDAGRRARRPRPSSKVDEDRRHHARRPPGKRPSRRRSGRASSLK